MINFKLEKLKFLKIEKRHTRIMLLMKIALTASFFAINFLPNSQAVWVAGASNLIWLWEL